jgi:hypothetical protein
MGVERERLKCIEMEMKPVLGKVCGEVTVMLVAGNE